MSAQQWGQTGLVTLGKKRKNTDVMQNVRIDGVKVGRVFHPRGRSVIPDFCGYGAEADITGGYADGLPSLDVAVMWVLAHARGDGSDADRKLIRDVWRAERVGVVQVRRAAETLTLSVRASHSHYTWRFFGGAFVFYGDFAGTVRNADRWARGLMAVAS